MLQIVTGMYFRDVPLYETTHRAVLFTNAWALERGPIELPIGSFSFATSPSPVTAVTIEATERLEAVRPDGEPELVKATGGHELIDDAADVFAFALNVSCSRNAALMERFVPAQLDGRPTRMPWSILRRTFDPGVVLREAEIDDVRDFATRLLALRRDHFEAAMRSIRSVVDASLLVSDDPGLAYTLFVSSLESLAQLAIPVEEVRGWDTYDSKRRKVFDAAVVEAGLSPEQAEKLRAAVIEIDQLSLRRRFIEFTLGHIEGSYYRSEAVPAIRPIRAHDLPNALDVAYRLRSRNVHLLEALAPELWAISDRADALRFEGRSVLSLEGLNRLCRHVIRAFVRRAPTDLDTSFDYRASLPGKVTVQLAPQYWIGQREAFSAQRAHAVFEGFVELLVATMANPDQSQLVDLSGVLEKIELQLPATAERHVREPMVAIYILWHRFLNRDHHRERAEEVIDRYGPDLDPPSIVGFTVRLLTSNRIEWSVDELVQLVDQRREDLRRGRGQRLPARVDAALLLVTSLRIWEAGRADDGVGLIAEAVNALPGNEDLITIEERALEGEMPAFDLLAFVLGRQSAGHEAADDEQVDDGGDGDGGPTTEGGD